MKYEFKKMEKSFIPFQIVLTIETQQEAELFHDRVACVLAKSSTFIGSSFNAIVGDFRSGQSGEVPVDFKEGE